MPVVRPASADLLSISNALDQALGLVLRDVSEPYEGLGRYESDVEVRVLLVVMLRHAEAVLECVRSDLVLLPAAYTIARAVFEQGCKIRWLLQPTDVYEREARFLAHLADEERMWERCARSSGNSDFSHTSELIHDFRKSVETQLPDHITRLERVPTLEQMLTEFGERRYYTAYTLLSQYLHGSHFAGSDHRRGLGTAKVFGEYTPESAWAQVLQIVWWSFYKAAERIEHVCARRDIRSLSQLDLDKINRELERLREEMTHDV